MKRDERKSVKIDKQTARELLKAKADTGSDMYELIAESWKVYKQLKEGRLLDHITLTAPEIRRLIERYDREQPGFGLKIIPYSEDEWAVQVTEPISSEEEDEDPHPIPIRMDLPDLPRSADERTAVAEFLSRYRAGEKPLTTNSDVPGTTLEERHWIEKLLYILRSEDEEAIHAVQNNIVVCERTVTLTKETRRKKPKPPKAKENNA